MLITRTNGKRKNKGPVDPHTQLLVLSKLSATPWTAARQAPPSVGFSRHEYGTGLPCPPPGDLPDPGIELESPESAALAGGFFSRRQVGSPKRTIFDKQHDASCQEHRLVSESLHLAFFFLTVFFPPASYSCSRQLARAYFLDQGLKQRALAVKALDCPEIPYAQSHQQHQVPHPLGSCPCLSLEGGGDTAQGICCLIAKLYPTLCDPMDRSTPGLPAHHQLPEPTQTHVHRVGDAIQPTHPLPSPSPPALNLSQHQGLSQ